MEDLFIVLLVLAVVSVVGHCIWVFAAWVFRGFKSKSAKAAAPTLQDDRLATARYLFHLQSRGLMSEAERLHVLSRISQEAASPFAISSPPPVIARGATEGAQDGPELVRSLRDLKSSRDARFERISESHTSPTPTEFADEEDIEVVGCVDEDQTEWLDASQLPAEPVSPTEPVSQFSTAESAPAVRTEPRRPLAAVVASFMAEKNIRWGEIIGGLLIVSCSTALVISLWAQIAAIPILKFLIFCGMTAAVSGAGNFIFHRWKLPTTGHALLVISTLLIPLNLLAFAAFSDAGDPGGAITLIAELIATALFSWLALLAGRVVMPAMPKLFAAGVVSMAVSTLIVRILAPATAGSILAVGAIPVGLYLFVMGLSYRRWLGDDPSEPQHARRILLQLGVQSFAALVATGFMVYQIGPLQLALRNVAPLLCAMATPSLLIGIHLWKYYGGKITTGDRITAAAIALLAASVLLACAALAWPQPSSLIPVIAVNAIAMTVFARTVRQPVFQSIAIGWLSFGVVLLAHLAQGGISWSQTGAADLIHALNSALTGQTLVPIVLLAYGLAYAGHRRADQRSRRSHLAGAIMLMSVSAVLAMLNGFGRAGDPNHVIWVYAALALVGIAAAWLLRSAAAMWCGQLLLPVCAAQWFVFIHPLDAFAWPTTLLIVASACVVALFAIRVSRLKHHPAGAVLLPPLSQFTLIVSLVGFIWLIGPYSSGSLESLGARVAWTGGIWTLLAVAVGNAWIMSIAQVAYFLAAAIATHRTIQAQPWCAGGSFTNPWYWQIQFAIFGIACVVWSLIRLLLHRISPAADAVAAPQPGQEAAQLPATPARKPRSGMAESLRSVLNPKLLPATDQLGGYLLILSAVGLAAWALQPAIISELGLSTFTSFPGPYAHAAGWGSWVILLISCILIAIWRADHQRPQAAAGAIASLWAACALGAAQFEFAHHATLAWRSICAAVCLMIGVSLWIRRVIWNRPLSANPWTTATTLGEFIRPGVLLEMVFAVPVLALTVGSALAVGDHVGQFALPATDAGLRLWLLAPAIALVAACIGFGLADSRNTNAFIAALIACGTTTLTENAIFVRAGGAPFSDIVWLIQLNAMVFGATILCWHFFRQFRRTKVGAPPRLPPWPFYLFRAANGLLLLLSAIAITLYPVTLGPIVVRAGSIGSILAIVSIELALLYGGLPKRRHHAGRNTLWLLFATVILSSALHAAGWDSGNWETYHALMTGLALAGAARLVIGRYEILAYSGAGPNEAIDAARAGDSETVEFDLSCRQCGYNLRSLELASRCPECGISVNASRDAALERLTPAWAARLTRLRASIATMATFCLALGTVLVVRSGIDDPLAPWWSAGVGVALAALALFMAAWSPRRSIACLGAIELCLAVSQCWDHWRPTTTTLIAGGAWVEFVCINIAALSLISGVWIWIERKYLRRLLPTENGSPPFALHQFGAFAGIAAVLVVAGLAMSSLWTQQVYVAVSPVVWVAWGSVTALVILCAIKREFDQSAAGLYLLGLAGLVLLTCQMRVPKESLVCILALELGGYTLAAALVWRGSRERVKEEAAKRNAIALFASGHVVLALIACGLAVYASITEPSITIRLLVAAAPCLTAGGSFLLARDQSPGRWHASGLLAIFLGVVLALWSVIPAESLTDISQRSMLLATATAFMIIVSAAIKRWAGQESAFNQAVPLTAGILTIVGAISVGLVTAVNVQSIANHVATPGAPAIRYACLAALAILPLVLIIFAVKERLDPWQLRPTLRGIHVYAAEVVAALLGIHVRATMPWLFSGFLTQYWPILVMGLAFLAISAGEFLERRKLPVLAKPLAHSGVFLPALSMLDIFLAASRVHFTIVLLTAGALYAVVAALRRSPLFGLISSFSFTGALWYWLHHAEGLDITRHPQLWFIPPALAVLAAAHFSRSQLKESQRKSINYAGLIAIYASSTADIFLIGVSTAPWLPLVLGGLSVAGILIGIGFRVRSFLQLGSAFLCVSLLTIIWHAANDLGWTWVWYVAGIGLGAMIITLFALFEKKREEMKSMLREVREWEG